MIIPRRAIFICSQAIAGLAAMLAGCTHAPAPPTAADFPLSCELATVGGRQFLRYDIRNNYGRSVFVGVDSACHWEYSMEFSGPGFHFARGEGPRIAFMNRTPDYWLVPAYRADPSGEIFGEFPLPKGGIPPRDLRAYDGTFTLTVGLLVAIRSDSEGYGVNLHWTGHIHKGQITAATQPAATGPSQ